MSDRRAGKVFATSQSGVALVVSLLIMLIITLIASSLAFSSRSGTQVGTGFSNQHTAFEVAVAGLEYGRDLARYNRFTDKTTSFSSYLLADAKNVANGLVDSTQLANFGITNGFVQDTSKSGTGNAPFIIPTGLDNSSYAVFMTNDPTEGVTTTTDKNDRITLTSFGSAPNQVGFAVVQGVLEPPPQANVPTIPPITMPGPDVSITLPNSQATTTGKDPGLCLPTIAVSTQTARNTVVTNSQFTKRSGNYTTCNPAGGADLSGANTVDNFYNTTCAGCTSNPYAGVGNTPNTPTLQENPTGNLNQLVNVSYYDNLFTTLSGIADYTTTQSGANLSCGGAIDCGSATKPTIVAIDVGTGTFTIGPGQHYGILIVRGNVTMNGNATYNGQVWVIGPGNILRNGNGSGTFCGGFVVACTVAACGASGNLVGTPTYNQNGGGGSILGGCDFQAGGGLARWSRPMKLVSFQQLR